MAEKTLKMVTKDSRKTLTKKKPPTNDIINKKDFINSLDALILGLSKMHYVGYTEGVYDLKSAIIKSLN